MKCPKCDYLGFETGDRCRNCGYDFSLLPLPEATTPDLPLRAPTDTGATAAWLDQVDPRPTVAGTDADPSRALPLFSRMRDDDAPLVTLPSSPRPPLSVRRTPDMPRSRALPTSPPRMPEPTLEFSDDPEPGPADTPAVTVLPVSVTSSGRRRVAAALIDHAILLTIDLAVFYFTLRLAALPMREWTTLPPVPMLTFLSLLALAYFSAFTGLGGQTMGKMALGIRVVSDTRRDVDAPHAIARALIAALSVVTLGLGYLPGLIRADKRTLHDLVMRTRVVVVNPVVNSAVHPVVHAVEHSA